MPIRPYEAKDRDNVRYICLNSDGPCDADEKGQHFLLTTYCDYYIEYEPHNCFVFADKNDRAVGYVLIAEDFETFKDVFLNEFKPRLADDADQKGTLESIQLHERNKENYPAHLHIDLLPEIQGKGIGTQMMKAALAHLAEKKCRGLTLTVWKHNRDAMRFYERLGFVPLGETESNVAWGIVP